MIIQKKPFGGEGGGGSGQVRGRGQGGSEKRIEVFVKIKKKSGAGVSGWGVRVDVNEEVKLLCKFQKQNRGGGRRIRLCRVRRVQGGPEQRMEVFV